MARRLTPQDRQAVANVWNPDDRSDMRKELLGYSAPTSLAECRCGHQGQEHDQLYGCDVCSCLDFIDIEVAQA